jgi:hypothetical protein
VICKRPYATTRKATQRKASRTYKFFKGIKLLPISLNLQTFLAKENAPKYGATTLIDTELLENRHIAYQNRYTALLF